MSKLVLVEHLDVAAPSVMLSNNVLCCCTVQPVTSSFLSPNLVVISRATRECCSCSTSSSPAYSVSIVVPPNCSSDPVCCLFCNFIPIHFFPSRVTWFLTFLLIKLAHFGKAKSELPLQSNPCTVHRGQLMLFYHQATIVCIK